MKDAVARFVGKHVAAGRTRRRLTQQELATKVGISRQALSAIERGKQMPSMDTLYTVGHVLGMEAFDLLPTYSQVSADE